MFIDRLPVWHASGTRAPSLRERRRARPGIWSPTPFDAVPLRATSVADGGEKGLVRAGIRPSFKASGTKWHAGPLQSVRGDWRTR